MRCGTVCVKRADVVSAISADSCRHVCVVSAAPLHVSVPLCVLCTATCVTFVQPHSKTLCVCVCFVSFWSCVSSAGCISGCEFPFPVSSHGAPSLADDLCVVFVVELDKGPYGLGMGLIDGLVSSLMTQKQMWRLYSFFGLTAELQEINLICLF